jgi:hypothetical protein
MKSIEDVRGKIPPEVEQRLDKAVEKFKENHKDPTNVILHVVGYWAIARGLRRFLGRKKFRGLVLVGIGISVLLAGHNIEGSDAFTVVRSLATNGSK